MITPGVQHGIINGSARAKMVAGRPVGAFFHFRIFFLLPAGRSADKQPKNKKKKKSGAHLVLRHSPSHWRCTDCIQSQPLFGWASSTEWSGRMCAGFNREFPIAPCCAYAVTRQYRVDSVVEQASPGASNLSRPLFTFSVVVVFEDRSRCL